MTATQTRPDASDTDADKRREFAQRQREALEEAGLPAGLFMRELFDAATVTHSVKALELAQALATGWSTDRADCLVQAEHLLRLLNAELSPDGLNRALQDRQVAWEVNNIGSFKHQLEGTVFLLEQASSNAAVAAAIGVDFQTPDQTPAGADQTTADADEPTTPRVDDSSVPADGEPKLDLDAVVAALQEQHN